MKKSNLSITKTARHKLPAGGSVLFEKLKEKVLGKRYELSLVFCGDTLSRKLNKKHRNKDRPTNVLSFPYSKNEGEIFINLSAVKKETEKFQMTEKKLLLFLFIHGMLHLKGFEHGSRMEREENRFLKQI